MKLRPNASIDGTVAFPNIERAAAGHLAQALAGILHNMSGKADFQRAIVTKDLYHLAIVCVTALICGCAATTDDRRPDTVTFTLKAEPRNAGQVGKVLMGAQGDNTLIVLNISGVPPWVGRPVQLYTFIYAGSCANHGATPAYALNEIVQTGLYSNSRVSGPFTLEKTAPIAMEKLRAGDYAIILRTSPADGSVDIFCGEMK